MNSVIWDIGFPWRQTQTQTTLKFDLLTLYPCSAPLPPLPCCTLHWRWYISKSHSFCREKWGLPHNPNSLRENSLGGVPHAQCIPYALSEAKRHPILHIWHGPPMLADIFLLRLSDWLHLSGSWRVSSMISSFFDVCVFSELDNIRGSRFLQLWSVKTVKTITLPLVNDFLFFIY